MSLNVHYVKMTKKFFHVMKLKFESGINDTSKQFKGL